MTEVQRATTMQAWLYAARSCVHIVEELEAACTVLLRQIRRFLNWRGTLMSTCISAVSMCTNLDLNP